MTRVGKVSLAKAMELVYEKEKENRIPPWKRFYEKHKDKELARRKAYREQHREEIKEYHRQRRLAAKQEKAHAIGKVSKKKGEVTCST